MQPKRKTEHPKGGKPQGTRSQDTHKRLVKGFGSGIKDPKTVVDGDLGALSGKTVLDVNGHGNGHENGSGSQKSKIEIGDEISIAGRSDEWFEIIDIAGAGGFGTVFIAYHVKVDPEAMAEEKLDHENLLNKKLVALKFVEFKGERGKETEERFLAEMRVLREFDNPNIVNVMNYHRTEEGLLYYVMELLKGNDLYQEIQKADGGVLSWEQTQPIIIQLCDALKAAHDKGLVHFDIKPGNLILIPIGNTKLLKVVDFGLVRQMDGDQKQAEENRKKGIIDGSPNYIAPEQFRREKADHRADIYSTGVVLFQMLTGDVPFIYMGNDNAVEFMTQVAEEPAKMDLLMADPRIPAEVIDAVEKCLAKDPNDRFQDIGELKEILEKAGSVSSGPLIKPRPRKAKEEKASETLTIREKKEDEKEGRPRMAKVIATVSIIAATLVAGVTVGVSSMIGGNEIPATTAPAPIVPSKPALREPVKASVKPQPTKASPAVLLSSEPIITDTAPEPEQPAPEKTMHNITIETNVAGARVYVGGDKVGSTDTDGSFTFQQEPSAEKIRVSVRKTGYETVRFFLTPDSDHEKSFRMKRAAKREVSPYAFDPSKRRQR